MPEILFITVDVPPPLVGPPAPPRLIQTAPVRRENLMRRTITLEWTVGDGLDHYDKPCKVYVVLSINHWKDRKTFTATLHTETGDGVGRMWDVFGTPNPRISATPVARYSDKAFLAFADEALRTLRALRDRDDIRSLFGEA